MIIKGRLRTIWRAEKRELGLSQLVEQLCEKKEGSCQTKEGNCKSKKDVCQNKEDRCDEYKEENDIFPSSQNDFHSKEDGDQNSTQNASLHEIDLNYPPHPPEVAPENRQIVQAAPEKKKRRAATKDVAKIDLADLSKYFNLTITEASKRMNIGLTVLKRKCREFGIPRWPHRKIKSLDNLIIDLKLLQKEKDWQDRVCASAAIAVMKRQRMLENEKEDIEKKPFMDIQIETKRFRQDVFKRKHYARTRNKKKDGDSISLNLSSKINA